MSAHAHNKWFGFILTAVLAVSAGQGQAADEGWKTGQPLPALAGFVLEGDLPSFAGKVVVLDFWASWCGPCRASFPVLDALNKTYAGRGVVLVGVNLDKDAAKMTAFLKAHPVSFAIVRDAGQKLVKEARINAMPTTLIVGRDGVIREIHSGFTTKEGPARLTAAIEAALGKEGP